MMRQTIDVRDIFDRIGVEYTTRKNVSGNNVAIKCPWCGDADPSAHLTIGIPPNRPYYNCWRNPSHKGRDLLRLLRQVCDWDVRELLGLLARYNVRVDSADAVEPTTRPKVVADAVNWREFDGRYSAEKPFFAYLRDARGFGKWTAQLLRKHDLRYAVTGKMAWRIVFPLYRTGSVVSAIGRAVHSDTVPRYLALSTSDSVVPTRELVYNGHRREPRVLVTEGPMDALKLDVAAEFYAAVPVATMTTTPSTARIIRLAEMDAEAYYIIYDSGADSAAYRLREELDALVGGSVHVITGVLKTDPGDLPVADVPDFLSTVLR